jgi:hypothetical protein
MTRRSLCTVSLAFALALALVASPSLGQSDEPLPAELVRQSQISGAELQRVQAFIRENAEAATSEDAETREAAREALIAPLRLSPSPSFRIEYGGGVRLLLQQVARSDETADVVFAATLAGHLATVDAHALVLRLLGDDRAPVRYAAARAARLQLETLDPGPAALNAQHRDQLIAALAERVAVEPNAVVLDGLLTSASEAVRRETAWAAAILEAFAAALPENIRTGAPGSDRLAEARAYLRLVGSAQQYFRRNLRSAPESLAHESALLAGHAMGFVDTAVEESLDEGASRAIGQLAKAAYNLGFFAHSVRAGGQLQASEAFADAVDRWLERGDADDLAREIDEWIGAGGILTQRPYEAAPEEFLGG